MSTPQEVITSLTLAPLGAPRLPTELEISPLDFEAALVKYYSYVPYKKSENYSVTGIYSFKQEMAALLPAPEFFYIGVISFAMRSQINQSRMDEYLLGNNFVSPNIPVDRQAYFNTMIDMQTGDPYYEEDFVLGEVRWTVGARGTFCVIYGLGHNDINKVPARHYELMAALVGCVYYERLMAIRKTGAFQGADFTLDTSVLASALERAQTRSAEILESIGLVPVTLG